MVGRFVLLFVFVLLCISADWLNHTVGSSTEKKTEVNCSQCSALAPALVHTRTDTFKRTQTLTPMFELVDSLLWDKWSDGARGGLHDTKRIGPVRMTDSTSSCTHCSTAHTSCGKTEKERKIWQEEFK